jgi:hypothetical protein
MKKENRKKRKRIKASWAGLYSFWPSRITHRTSPSGECSTAPTSGAPLSASPAFSTRARPTSLSLMGGARTSSLTNRPHWPGLLLVAAATSATAPSQVRGLDRGIRTYAPHLPCPISSPRQPGHSSATRIVRRVAYGCSVTASSTSDRSSSPPRSVLESAEASSSCGGSIRGIGEEGVSTEATEFLTGDPRTRNLGVVPPLPQIRGKINSLRSVLLSSTSSSARNLVWGLEHGNWATGHGLRRGRGAAPPSRVLGGRG